ncbi:MAG: quinone oxidoreductase family protein [Acetobacteraceae bacterium]
MKMRAVVVPRFGGPEVLRVVDKPRPEPKEDQVLVKLKYAGVTYGDVYQREGTYRGGVPLKEGDAALPIGTEGAGTVVAAGAGVAHLKEGDSVVYADHMGSYAEYAAVPAWRVVKVPKAVSLANAAAAFSQGATAHYLAFDTGKLQAGSSCLIHAAAGGVGHLLLQFAKMAGARVFTTVGNAEKAAFVRSLGADEAIEYRNIDFLDEVRRITGGRGVDVVYDSVGAATIGRSIKAVTMHGLCVLYGNTSGMVETVAPMELAAAGSIFFTRPRLGHHMRSREEITKRADAIFSALAGGSLKVSIQRSFAIDDVAELHRLLQSRATIGKLMLTLE